MSSEKFEFCVEDIDCVSTLVCLTPRENEGNTSFCDCAYYLGFQGENCLEINPYYKGIISFDIFSIALLTFIIGTAVIKDLPILFTNSSFRKPNSVTLNWIYVLIAIVAQIVAKVLLTIMLLQPSKFGDGTKTNDNNVKLTDKARSFTDAGISISTVVFLFGDLSYFTISLVWFYNVESVKRMKVVLESAATRRLRTFVYVDTAAILFFQIIVASLGYIQLLLILNLLNIMIAVTVIYYFGWSRLLRTLAKHESLRNSQAYRLLYRFGVASAWAAIGVLLGLGIFILGIFTDTKKVREGELDFYYLGHTIVNYSITFALAVNFYYLHETITGYARFKSSLKNTGESGTSGPGFSTSKTKETNILDSI